MDLHGSSGPTVDPKRSPNTLLLTGRAKILVRRDGPATPMAIEVLRTPEATHNPSLAIQAAAVQEPSWLQ